MFNFFLKKNTLNVILMPNTGKFKDYSYTFIDGKRLGEFSYRIENNTAYMSTACPNEEYFDKLLINGIKQIIKENPKTELFIETCPSYSSTWLKYGGSWISMFDPDVSKHCNNTGGCAKLSMNSRLKKAIEENDDTIRII